MKHGVIALAHARGENPLHHFGVGSGGKIGAAQGRMRSEIFARSADAEPIRILLKCGKKIGEPAIFVAVLVRAGPNAEFFHVVAHGGHAAGVNAGGIAQIGEDVFDFAERNEVAQGLLAGVEPHTFAPVFGDVSAKQFFGLEPGGEKVHVVHERVGDFSLGKNAGKLRLPDPLGEPGA